MSLSYSPLHSPRSPILSLRSRIYTTRFTSKNLASVTRLSQSTFWDMQLETHKLQSTLPSGKYSTTWLVNWYSPPLPLIWENIQSSSKFGGNSMQGTRGIEGVRWIEGMEGTGVYCCDELVLGFWYILAHLWLVEVIRLGFWFLFRGDQSLLWRRGRRLFHGH